MSDRLPYEEQLAQQWNDLPLPDENMAWKDMKRRLEEDDDDGIIPIWLRGCGLWGLLAIVLLGLGWWLIRPDKWGNKKQGTETVTTTGQKENTGDNKNKTSTVDTIRITKGADKQVQTGDVEITSEKDRPDSSSTSLSPGQRKTSPKKQTGASLVVTSTQSKKKKTGNGQLTVGSSNEKTKQPNNKKQQKQTGTEQVDISTEPGIKNKEAVPVPVPVEIKDKPVVQINDSLSTAKTNTSPVDTIRKTPPDSTQEKTGEPVAKKDSSKPKSISFSAGIAIHQLVPIDGQQLTPYNSLGRKGSLADYIPSVHGRMYINNKWFLQLEFRYGAPQSTKEFTYKQAIKLDTVGPLNNHTITTSSSLKKTFYHQLPLTFNYFILPDWSVGTGLVWNKFVSAVSQQDLIRRNITTLVVDSTRSDIITDKNDSLFKKSYFQAVFETQYRWRRFSLGARYSFGLQPYIQFTLPGGTQQQEKNKTLQVFLRYELWKSKAKSSKE